MPRMTRILNILLVLFSCTSCYLHEGQLGTSRNLNAAKSNGMFVSEYAVIGGKFSSGSDTFIEVVEVWVEKRWKYDKYAKPIIDHRGGYNIRMNVRSQDDLEGLGTKWQPGIDKTIFFVPSGLNGMIAYAKIIPDDTIAVYVQNGSKLNLEFDDYEILDTIVMVRTE